jgi:hypothetical protein
MVVTTQSTILREGHPVSFCHSASGPSSPDACTAGNEGPEDADISCLLRMLKSVPDPRSPQGIQHALVFMLAACVVAALAGARNYREIAGHAADVPQPLLKQGFVKVGVAVRDLWGGLTRSCGGFRGSRSRYFK